MNERDDDLDRLLATLPLEEPPAGLRSDILTATVHRVPADPVASWEAALLGLLLALALWMLPQFSHIGTLVNTVSQAAFALAQPSIVLWIIAGSAVAFAASSLPEFSGALNLARKGR
ncbi:MAG TPA: hypothetical protein VMV73_01240 [Candidatus Dormibacteraeota bacterium]|nr:hypothetical protein [Candidatus Dormibacteraeota bacterium]